MLPPPLNGELVFSLTHSHYHLWLSDATSCKLVSCFSCALLLLQGVAQHFLLLPCFLIPVFAHSRLIWWPVKPQSLGS